MQDNKSLILYLCNYSQSTQAKSTTDLHPKYYAINIRSENSAKTTWSSLFQLAKMYNSHVNAKFQEINHESAVSDEGHNLKSAINWNISLLSNTFFTTPTVMMGRENTEQRRQN
jgi:hypothetical protein